MVEAKPFSRRIVRFGVFEVDLRAGELRKGGVKVKLQEQPFQILSLLLEDPGEVVTREEIQQRLWPDGTFVDFEHSLNAAVKRLRETLDDSADTPRFVETPKKSPNPTSLSPASASARLDCASGSGGAGGDAVGAKRGWAAGSALR
jgi:hypothetical protein